MSKRYIILQGNAPLERCDFPASRGLPATPRGGVLVHGDHAEAFARRTAIRLMARTRRYAELTKFPWDCRFRLWPVREAKHGKAH